MRLSAPLFRLARKKVSAAVVSDSKTSASSSPSRLSTLKVAQLQHIAFLTGVASAGTKSELIDRLSRSLQSPSNGENPSIVPGRQRAREKGEKMSVLSIDMGIRNLAYAHLMVSPRSPTSSAARAKAKVRENGPVADVVLNAWNRLAVSSFPVSDAEDARKLGFLLDTFGGGASPMNAGTATPSRRKSSGRESAKATAEDGDSTSEHGTTPPSTALSKSIEKESFAPHIYASHAYNLITSLIAAYKPTHILIERQRFRSGGGSAVLEWTIRVGVFEGMLYAVLQTLKSESRRQRQRTAQTGGIAEHEMADVEDICVLGVEPQRVAKYWAETTQLEEKEKKKEGKAGTTAIRRKQTTAKEGKKAKIDVIGSLLSGNGTNSSGAAELIRPSVRVGDNMLARQVASAFLDKWSRSATGRKRRPASSARSGKGTGQKRQGSEEQEDYAIDVGKLDDLADSLLQGVTWLAWRNMRLHFAAGNRPFDDAPQGRD